MSQTKKYIKHIKYANEKKYLTNNKTRKANKYKVNLICNTSANTFQRFEDDYEKTLKGNLKKLNTRAEKEMVTLLKLPFSPYHITAQRDYYKYINYL